jgi:phenylacetic acid degradation operon negative regulatory protein
MRRKFVMALPRLIGYGLPMKSKTEELLYFLLWSCEMLAHPTFRNLTESFEGWAYRNGFRRQVAELQRQKLLASQSVSTKPPDRSNRVVRLTEAGRLHALGGRDPERCWRRHWNRRWCLVLFDLPVAESAARDRLRRSLRRSGFGYLQNSVLISPDLPRAEKVMLAGTRSDVESLILLEARPCAGESDEQIVAGAWDFAEINRLYGNHLSVLDARPHGRFRDVAAAHAFHKWATCERIAWLAAVSKDPLLPAPLLPKGYLGRKAWRARVDTMSQAADQIRSFRF